ncbi:hypothetical protein CFN78_12905 [Amycolatopsis antarctica]|uniref:Uncharacterized protein n=1 Tax=Amycolatopsis antarctica TaxID=1854586 RepID=A0A263D247_9PSEU|nr:hypothetical protein [Amycolatopsis antarctica]OZM72544.1 hypothetical protein CFN78_12905 [Amycolatopsis antarctica]
MSKRSDGRAALRTVRGCLLAISSAGLGTTAHTLADGGLPNLPLTILLTAIIGWTSTFLAERTRGVLGILAVLAAGQLLMHVVLTELAGHGHAISAATDGTAMTMAHVLATGLTAVVLARAERLLRLVAATLRLVVPTVFRSLPVPGPLARPEPRSRAGQALIELYFRRAHGVRGPPVFS